MEKIIKYFQNQTATNYEIIIVDDGSRDSTWNVIQDLITKKFPKEQIIGINYKKNSGKGYAVTTGMKYSRGAYILMLDADGATPISDYEKLKNVIDTIKTDENGVVVIGSRYSAQDESEGLSKVKFTNKNKSNIYLTKLFLLFFREILSENSSA